MPPRSPSPQLPFTPPPSLPPTPSTALKNNSAKLRVTARSSFCFFFFSQEKSHSWNLRVFRSRNHFLPSSLPCSSRPSARLAGAGRGRRRANRFAGHILSELNEIHQGCHSHGRARRRQADMPTLCPVPPPPAKSPNFPRTPRAP